MNRLNVFTYGYYSWRPRNWSNNIKQFFRNIKYAWQRATRGYCEWDTWNLDSYYLEHFISTLTYFRDHLHGAPHEFFDEGAANEVQRWEDYLTEVIAHFTNASLDRDEINTYAKEFFDNLDMSKGCLRERNETVWNNYCNEDKRLYDWQVDEVAAGLTMLKNQWYHLWD